MSELLPKGHKLYTEIIRGDRGEQFKANRIIRALVHAARDGKVLDLNEIAWRAGVGGEWTTEERMQLYQLMGYTIGGYCEIFAQELDEEDGYTDEKK